MAEEDLIFGKNRHFFGGIEPGNMANFSVESAYDYSSQKARIRIIAVLPSETVINGQQLNTVAGAVIRKKKDGFPVDEFDGELVRDIKENADFFDTDVILNDTVYYAAFPYSGQGVYNRSPRNRVQVKVQTYQYLYGYDLTVATTAPDARVAYPSDVQNSAFGAAKMNTQIGEFDYGGWKFQPGEKFMPRPCMLGFDGKVLEYLDPSDYTKTVDGQPSHVADLTFAGNAMMEWPKIFVSRKLEGGVYKFRCADIKVDDSYECWSNYDRKDHEIQHFYTPIYFGSRDSSGRMRSISGAANTVSTTAGAEINAAKLNGEDWYTEVAADRFLFQDLVVMMAKTTNPQLTFGMGRCASGNQNAIAPGTMNTRGLFWGDQTQTNGVKVFGMENPWGNLWRRTAGWINYNGTQKIKITRGKKDGSEASDYNLDGQGYLVVANATPAGTSGGYISAMQVQPWGRVPYQASGSATTYECDGLWYNNGQVDYSLVGGGWGDALLVGPFYVNLNSAASYTGATVGAALSCKPLAS